MNICYRMHSITVEETSPGEFSPFIDGRPTPGRKEGGTEPTLEKAVDSAKGWIDYFRIS